MDRKKPRPPLPSSPVMTSLFPAESAYLPIEKNPFIRPFNSLQWLKFPCRKFHQHSVSKLVISDSICSIFFYNDIHFLYWALEVSSNNNFINCYYLLFNHLITFTVIWHSTHHLLILIWLHSLSNQRECTTQQCKGSCCISLCKLKRFSSSLVNKKDWSPRLGVELSLQVE